MKSTVDGETLLALWERALAQPSPTRGDALLDALREGMPSARTLGERNVLLAGLHAQLFGRSIALLSHCPSCAAVAQFSGDCDMLAGQHVRDVTALSHGFTVDDYSIEYRLPDHGDVLDASAHDTDDAFARDLLERCILWCSRDGQPCAPPDLPLTVLDALSQRMEDLDPAANLSFALTCPDCATHWDARLDLGHLVWQKVQAAAERLLLDIDTLARAYGWTESEIMGLTSARRAAYIQLAAS